MIRLKTPKDIEILREGGKRLAAILQAVAKEAKAGVRTDALDALAEGLIRKGGDSPAFLGYRSGEDSRAYPATLCVSVNDEVVHGIPTKKPKTLKEGDIVSLDLGIIHEGLVTDHAVTVAIGKISKEEALLLEVTKKALDIGIKAAVGGKRTGDIGSAIQAFVEPYGFGIVRELAGHGVGYDVHEDPFVPNFGFAGQGALLKPGMVIAIEPMLTLGEPDVVMLKDGYTFKTKDGSMAAHFEHTVVITTSEAEILTRI